MSGIVTGAVMQHGPREANLAWTLSAIAEAADDHGFAVLSQESIALKIRKNRRTVIRNVQQLVEDGWLRVEHRVYGDDGKVSAYFIDVDRLGVVLNPRSRRSPLWDEIERKLARRAQLKQSGVQRRLELRWVAVDHDRPAAPVSGNLFASGDAMSPQTGEFGETAGASEVTKNAVEVTKDAARSDISDFAIRKNRGTVEPKDKAPQPPDERGEAASTRPAREREVRSPENREVQAAVAKIKRECGFSSPRLLRVIERALRDEAARTDEPPQWNTLAELMSRRFEEYNSLNGRGLLRWSVGATRFFGEIWNKPGSWPVDDGKVDRMRKIT